MKRLFFAVSLLSILFLAIYSSVEAHAELARSEPAANTALSSSPTSVKMWFTEPLDPNLSSARLQDGDAKLVEGTSITIDPSDTRIMTMSVPALGNGTYTARWTTFSIIDGHVLKGSFLFSVGVPLSQPAQGTEDSSLASRGGLPFILVKWAQLLFVLLWAGSLAFQALALPRAGSALSTEARRRAYPLLVVIVSIAAAVSVMDLVVQTVTLADGDFNGAFSWATVQGVASNRYGLLTLARIGLLLFSLFSLKHALADGDGRRWTWVQLSTAGLALMTMALSGHAATVSRPIYSAVVMDWLHLAGTAVWMGGIIYIAAVLIPAAKSGKARSDGGSIAAAVSVFSPLALGSVAVLAITGLLNAELHLESPRQLLTTTYGRALTVKLLLVAAMIVTSYIHAFVIRPAALQRRARGAEKATISGETWMARLIGLEVPLGILVLLAVAVMAAFPISAGMSKETTESVEQKKPLVLAGSAGDTLVTLSVDPNDLGLNTLTASLRDLNAAPVERALVRLRTRYLEQDSGSNFLVTESSGPGRFKATGSFSQKGRWQVDVNIRFPDSSETSASFTFSIPTPGAEDLLTQVQDRVNSLSSLKEKNILTGGPGGASIITESHYQRPNKLRMMDDKGRESIIIGDERYDKTGENWTQREFPGYAFPPLDLFTSPTDVIVIDTEEIGGKKVLVLAYQDPSLSAYFRWWIGADDFLPRKQLMAAPGHHMSSEYSDFDVPNHITPPESPIVSLLPTPTPNQMQPAPAVSPSRVVPPIPERSGRGLPFQPAQLAPGVMVAAAGITIVLAASRISSPQSRTADFVNILGFVVIGIGIYLLASTAIQSVRSIRNGQAEPLNSIPINPVPATAESIKAGEAIYLGNCVACHGESGKGDGPASRGMSPRPADLSTHVFLHPDGELRRFVTDGIPGTPMPRFNNLLSEEETWHLVNYLRRRFPGA